jgi:hypothetical protein
MLLKYGANPSISDGWAVVAAISQNRLELVKLLIDRPAERDTTCDEDVESKEMFGASRKKRRKSGEGGGGKRRKIEQRVIPNQAMMKEAMKRQNREIIDFLMSRGMSGAIDLLLTATDESHRRGTESRRFTHALVVLRKSNMYANAKHYYS